jgi:hypothetical protein
MRFLQYSILLVFVASCALAKDSKPKTAGEAVERAVKQSQLTLAGSKPFHLKAIIAELDSPGSDYKAEVEMYWVTPDHWRRTIKSPTFSQTMIVDGEKVSEQNQGDYFPWWLNNFVIALFHLGPEQIRSLNTPVPDLEALQKELAKKLPPGLMGMHMDTGNQCVRSQEPVGVDPVHNTVFTSVCFQNPSGLIQSILSPYFEAEFSDFRDFSGKRVARKISMTLQPGTKIEARIAELTGLEKPDQTMFAFTEPTAPQNRMSRMRVSESMARAALLGSPDIAWLPINNGKTKGTLSLGISVDKDGHVRETWPLNSDNPFPQDQARKAVSQWIFKPLVVNGTPQQMETILTFAFETKTGN